MADPYKTYSKGEPWQPIAQRENLISNLLRKDASSGVTTGGGGLAGLSHDGLILVQNNSGADRKVGEVLGIDDILITPAKNVSSFVFSPSIKGVVPTTDDHAGWFVICAQPITKGSLGQAYLFGYCAAWVNFTNADDSFAEVTDSDSTQLTSDKMTGSAQILSNPSGGTGKQWALIRIGPPPTPGILYGTVTGGDFTGGTTLTLNPSDIAGAPISGAATASVYVKADQSSYTMVSGTSVAYGTIVEYAMGADGNYYVLGTPRVEMTGDFQTATDGDGNPCIQIKKRDTWGLFCGTDSDWITVITGAIQCPPTS